MSAELSQFDLRFGEKMFPLETILKSDFGFYRTFTQWVTRVEIKVAAAFSNL
jgi:hypothetical protein